MKRPKTKIEWTDGKKPRPFAITNKIIIKLIKAVNQKDSPLPITNCALLNETSLAMTDLETTVLLPYRTGVRAAVEAKNIIHILENYETGEWRKEGKGTTRGEKVEFTCDGEKLKFEDWLADDFPKVMLDDKAKENKLGTVTPEDLEQMLLALEFTGHDEMRPVMTTVYFHKQIVGTDAHRLMYIDAKKPMKEPVLFLRKPMKLMEIIGGNWDVSQVDVQIILRHESGIQIVFRAMDAKFPTYTAVIPKQEDMPTAITFDSKTLRERLDKSKRFWNSATKKVDLNIQENNITMTAESPEDNSEYIAAFPSKLEGPKLIIAFNGQLLNEVLEKIEGDVTMRMSAPNRAVVMNNKFLLMPVLLNN